MPKTYAAGDQLPAADMNAVIKVAGLYAASVAGTDTYVVTPSPAWGSYAAGDCLTLGADVTNTGVATVNVNGLGAKSIFRPDGSALANGDIIVGPNRLNYDGSAFRLAAWPKPFTKVISTSKTASDASVTQNIAHGGVIIPRKVKVTAISNRGTGAETFHQAVGVYDGASQASGSYYTSGNFSDVIDNSFTLNDALASGTQTGVITADATNAIITWTKTGSPTGSYTLIVECEF